MHRLLQQLRLQVTSAPPPQGRAGLAAGPFRVHPVAPILARLPLLPVDGDVDGVLDEGVFLASRQLSEVRAATERSRQSMRAYELRARWRPTPHAVFAGVTLADVVDGPARLQMGSQHRARTNPSATWLSAVCATLLDREAGDDLLRRLTLTADANAVRRAERWEMEAQPAAGRGAVQRCTVRATPAMDLIMAVCADGANTRTICDAIQSRWPQAPESTVLNTLSELMGHGFLLTDLLASHVSDDPIGQLLGALPATHPVREPLRELRTVLTGADTHAPGHRGRRHALVAARDIADRICPVEQPLTVDVAVDAQIAIARSMVTQAVEAAQVLWRIAPRCDPAADFHRRFVDRYGHHRYVPLLDAADPVTGIGWPDPHETTPKLKPDREAVLNGLIAKSYAEHCLEVELDTATVTALTGTDTMPPPGADVYVRLVADNDQAAAQGRLGMVVLGCAPTAGSTIARFAALLGHHHTEPDHGPAVNAELAVRPRSISAQTVAPTTGFAGHRIPIGIPATNEHDLRLRDLLLVSDGANFLVWSAALNRQVLPTLYSRLAPALLPPIARLLYVLGQSGTTPWHTWSWGTFASPFHPRIRYRDTILSPARWTLPAALLAAAPDRDHWDTELDRWLTTTVPGPPPTVLTEDDDRQLPLTLNRTDDRQLLRRYVRRGLTSVTEPPGGHERTGAVAVGPHGRHLAELVIPVLRRTDPRSAPHHAPLPARTRGEGLFHPGGPWLSLALPTEPHLQDQLLLRMADLVGELADAWDSWFWLRYQTTALGHHLRVRFHGRPDILGGHLLPALAEWAASMTDQQLAGRMVIECYEQEIERYGGPAAIDLAEAAFAADSRLAIDLLPADPDDRIAAAAHVAATITRTVADKDPAALTGRHLERPARQTMNRLRPRVRAADTDDHKPGGTEWLPALRATLTAYRAALPEPVKATCASSLIHMHANRILPSADDEPLIRALAADLLARP